MMIEDIQNWTQEQLITETINNYQTINNQTTIINILLLTLIAIILIAILAFIIYERQKKILKERKQTQKELKELVETLQKIDKEITTQKIKVDEININNLPKELKTELLEKTNILNQIFSDKENKLEPILLLMKSNRTIEIMTNMTVGELILKNKNKKGEEEYAEISIGDDDIYTLIYGKKRIKIIVAHEKFSTPLPHFKDTKASKSLYYIIEKIKMTEGLLQPIGKGFPKIIILIVVLAIVGAIGFYLWNQTMGGSPPSIQVINETANQTIQMINTTVKVIKV